MKRTALACLAGVSLGCAVPAFAQAPPGSAVSQGQGTPQLPSGQTFEEEIVPQHYANNPAIDSFVDDMAARYDFDPAALHALFGQVNYSATAVKLVLPSPTPKAKNWQAYQARFLDAVRIDAGVRFWRSNRDALRRAAREYGIPPEIIVGILGVETIYGRYMGNFRVLDTLTTLAFDYPPVPNQQDRKATFKTNLEDFLVWTRGAGIDPLSVQGSFAGAIGIPQFMPSSILHYAVDFDGSGVVDLTRSPADAIGSVANFLKLHGWEIGRPVVWQIAGDEGSQGIALAAADGQPEPHWALDQLVRAGMLLNQPGLNVEAERGTPVTVIDLPTPNQPVAYALGLRNFYVLTRYNRSFFYAMAVYELGERIKSRVEATGDYDAPVVGASPVTPLQPPQPQQPPQQQPQPQQPSQQQPQ